MLEVRMEKIPQSMSERKTVRPTIEIVRQVLSAAEACGVWTLRVQERIRKRTQERFRAMRLENAGSYQMVRIRCKPGGNETGYEYWLVPPQFCEINKIFSELCTVHPKTLKMVNLQLTDPTSMQVETISVKELGIIDKVAHRTAPPPVLVRRLSAQAREIASAPSGTAEEFERSQKGIASKIESAKSDSESEKEERPEVTQVRDASCEIKTEVKESRPTISLSLLSAVASDVLMSEQCVLDRALIAIAMVTKSGYAPRLVVSDSIIRNLDVPGFVLKSDVYTSLESANRALVMGLCGEKLLDRVTNGRGTLKGYKLTTKGEKRIIALREFLSDVKLDEDWSDGIYDAKAEMIAADLGAEDLVVKLGDVNPKAASSDVSAETETEEFDDGYIKRLESFVKEIKAHNENSTAIKKLLEEARTERSDIVTHLSGVNLAIEGKIKEKEDLEAEIVRLGGKKTDLEKKIKAKDEDIECCVTELDELNKKKAELDASKMRIR